VQLEIPDGSVEETKAIIDWAHFSLADPHTTSDQKNRVVVRLVELTSRLAKGTKVYASKELCEELQHDWIHDYAARVNAPPRNLPLRCPCCGCKTLSERVGFEICEVCFWEDDGQDDADADENRGGPNGSLSLTQARINYREMGACEPDMLPNVRPPKPNELPD